MLRWQNAQSERLEYQHYMKLDAEGCFASSTLFLSEVKFEFNELYLALELIDLLALRWSREE